MHLNSWLHGVSTAPQAAMTIRRTPHEPPPESELSVVSHVIGAQDESIIVDLGHNSFVNLISMQLWDREPRSASLFLNSTCCAQPTPLKRVVDLGRYFYRPHQT